MVHLPVGESRKTMEEESIKDFDLWRPKPIERGGRGAHSRVTTRRIEE